MIKLFFLCHFFCLTEEKRESIIGEAKDSERFNSLRCANE